jgi:hypothetical protein
MGKAIYCSFPRCKNERVGLCALHAAIYQQVANTYAQRFRDMSFNDYVLDTWPIIEVMEEQWREIQRLQRRVHNAENELQRIMAGT